MIDDDPAVIRAREAARLAAAAELREQLASLAGEVSKVARVDMDSAAHLLYIAAAMDRVRAAAEQTTHQAIALARAEPDASLRPTWDQIGDQLGMDRRNAHRKYAAKRNP